METTGTTETTGITRIIERNKLFLKSLIIGAMALALWLPTNIILELVRERSSRQEEAVTDISNKWAGKQTISGPVLCIPYYQDNGDTVYDKLSPKKFAYIFPDKLDVTSTMFPEKRHRGIYEVGVYRAEMHLSGKFKSQSFEELNISSRNFLWAEAKILFNVTDPVRGINEDVFINWDSTRLIFNGQSPTKDSFQRAFAASLPLSAGEILKDHEFKMNLSINGSSHLFISPLGHENSIQLKSSWQDPAFTGVKLPDTRQVNDSGFVANWKFLNRNMPVLKDAGKEQFETAMGVELLIPVDNYDKTERSVKYALLCIMLTFAAFFLIETIYKKPLHLVQYGLAGLALVLFYTLLLSISEYTGFNIAYVISGAATIGLISWFVGSIMQSTKLAMFVSLVLLVVYSYIYTLIQLEDYSLLMGSIGLFLALAVIMFFSRRLKWENADA